MTDFVKFYDIALNVIENGFFTYCKPSYLNKNIKFSFGLQKQHKISYRVIFLLVIDITNNGFCSIKKKTLGQ